MNNNETLKHQELAYNGHIVIDSRKLSNLVGGAWKSDNRIPLRTLETLSSFMNLSPHELSHLRFICVEKTFRSTEASASGWVNGDPIW